MRTDRLTSDQVKATHPERTIWVAASAGTGKTHVLIARFLRLMLRGTPPDRILAITFTRAAAAEMANRLRQTLSRWVALADKPLAADIRATTGETAGARALQRARELFGLVLDLPGGLHIQTIHAFCQSVLARFPLEAGLSPGFQILDDRTAQEVLRDSVDDFLKSSRPGDDGERDHALAVLSEAAVGEFEDLVKMAAGRRGELQALSDHWGGLGKAGQALRRALGLNDGTGEADILRRAFSSDAWPKEELARLAEALSIGSAPEQARAGLIKAQLAAELGDLPSFDEYRNAFLTQSGQPRKTLVNVPTERAHPGVQEIAEAEAARLVELDEKLSLARVAERTEALYAVTESLFDHHAAFKRRRNLVDYDDLIEKSLRLLSAPGMSPWVLYKLDGGIDHILIDEAQDTNPAQWRLIERLTEEFYSGEGVPHGTRTIFAVGDRKQSIFSFQGAVPDAFLKARDRIQVKTRQASADFRKVGLDLSFRSTDAVLRLVDAVFPDGPGHRVHRSADAGRVELWPPVPTVSREEPVDWNPPVAQGVPADAQASLARRIADKIVELLDSEEKLPARGAPIRPGDIMVLVRRRTAFVDLVVKALKDRNIPVAGIDRIKLLDQLAVQDLLVLGDFALLPEDDLTLATLLKSPLVGLDEEALFTLAFERGDASLWRRLQARASEDARLGAAYEELSDALKHADYLNPYEFFARVLETRGGRKKLVARLGEDANDPIDEFLSLAIQYEQAHPPSLSGFLSWFRGGTSEVKRDMEAGRNEVRVLTIHGAKGLQAPIVFLPDTCQLPRLDSAILELPDPEDAHTPPFLLWPGRKGDERGAIEAARQASDKAAMEEYDRLLYVALTRAADRLYITGWEGKSGRTAGSWYDRIAAAFDNLSGAASFTEAEDREIRFLETEQRQAPSQSTSGTYAGAKSVSLPAWISKNPPAETAPIPKAITGMVEYIAASGGAKAPTDRARERGIWIHALIERLADVDPGRRATVAEKLMAGLAPGASAEETSEAVTEALDVLGASDLAHIFGPNSLAEVAVEGKVGDDWLSGRIDRLVVSNESVLLIDFKTQRNPPRQAEVVSADILSQLAGYRQLIGQVYPNRDIRAAVLWTADKRLMHLFEDR